MNASLPLASEQVIDVAESLDLSDDAIDVAEQLAEAADFEHPINRSPDVTAGGAAYLAGLLKNEKRYRSEVAEVADVSEVQISKAYHEIAYHEEILLSKNTKMGKKQREEGLKWGNWDR